MNKSLLSRLGAVLLVSIPLGFLGHSADKSNLDLMQNSLNDYIVKMKDLYSGSTLSDIIYIFIMLAIAMLCVEGISFLLRGEWKKK